MKKNPILSLMILGLVTMSTSIFAMTPRLKFPEWNKTSIRPTAWDPIKGILTIGVEVEANKIEIKKVHSQPYLQSSFNTLLSRYEKENIKVGEKAVFNHRINIKSNTDNWLEMDVRALPVVDGLKSLIKQEYEKNPTTREILEAEANNIKAPIFIGTSMPIFVRDDIALCVTPEIAFTPSFSHNNATYYIWMPLNSAESQTTNSAIKLFKDAVEKKSIKEIETSGQSLLNRFETDKVSIVFKRAKGDNFMIPTKVALEMLKADISCLKAILSNDTKELEDMYKGMKPSYTKAFVAFNLASLFKSQKNIEKAREYLKEALEEQPAWPMAQSLLSEN